MIKSKLLFPISLPWNAHTRYLNLKYLGLAAQFQGLHGLGLLKEWVCRKQEQLVLVNVLVSEDFNETKPFEVGFVYDIAYIMMQGAPKSLRFYIFEFEIIFCFWIWFYCWEFNKHFNVLEIWYEQEKLNGF